MLKKLLWVAMAVTTTASIAFGWRERARAAALAESLQRATQAQEASGDCSRSTFASLGRAFTTALSAKRPAPAKPIAPPTGRTKEGGSFDDLPAEAQTKLFDATDKMKEEAKKKLNELASRLRLNVEQERGLHDGIEKMNARIAHSLDTLIALTTQKDAAPTRQVIDALVDGLNAIREAEDGFRAGLDDRQQRELQKDGVDLTNQVDTSILLTRFIAFAAAAPPSVNSEITTSAEDDSSEN